MKKFIASLFVWSILLGGGGAAYKFLYLDGMTFDGLFGTQVASNSTTNPIKPTSATIPVPPTTKPNDPPAVVNLPKLRLAIDGFSGYCVFRSEQFKDGLLKAGFDLELVDDKADYGKRMDTLKSGNTPFAVFTIDSFLGQLSYNGAAPAEIVLILDESRGADAMISYADGIKDIDALNDENAKLVMTPDSPSETLSRIVRAKFQLPKLPKVKKDFLIPCDGAAKVLEQFRVTNPKDKKAFVLWEPYVSMALKDGKAKGAQLLIDSGQFNGYIVDVLVVQKEFLDRHPDQVTTFVQTYLETLHSFLIKKDPHDMVQEVLKDFERIKLPQLTKQDAEHVVKGIRWKNTVENYAHFGIYRDKLQTISDMIAKITPVLEETKQPNEPQQGVAEPDTVWTNAILKSLYENKKFHLGYQSIEEDAGYATLSDNEWKNLIHVGAIKIAPIPFTRTDELNEYVSEPEKPAKQVLAEVAAALREWPQYYFLVEGDVKKDPADINDADKKKALERANLVVARLLSDEFKVPPERIKAVAAITGKAREVRVVAMRKP